MTILPNIEEAMEDARNGKLSPYWQNDLYRECHRQKLSDEEQQALSELERILSETPQWSSEEELHHDMANIGGRVWYCHYWEEHYSMVQLTEDRNGRFNTAYVLDRNTSPEMRREAALLAQKELADCMQEWGVLLLDAPVPEQMKYASLAEAASHLMQVLNDPEQHHWVKSVPQGCVACIGKCRTKGFGALPNKHFATQKVFLYRRKHCLHRLCVLSDRSPNEKHFGGKYHGKEEG